MEKRELSEKELREKKLSLAKGTKYLLDFMFYAGILVTISLPPSLKYIGKYPEAVEEHYLPALIIFAILGVLALLLHRPHDESLCSRQRPDGSLYFSAVWRFPRIPARLHSGWRE